MTNNPPKLAFDLAHDLQALAAMASNLTPYLYEDELYGFLARDLPHLTLGGLLLRLHRLSCLANTLDTEQQRIVQDARLNFEAERAQWAVHFDKKLQREIATRLMTCEQFLLEYTENPRALAAGYPAQAEKRTIITHLHDAALEQEVWSEEAARRLITIDQRLRRSFQAGNFISDPRLAACYPPEQFWWMYGCLAEER